MDVEAGKRKRTFRQPPNKRPKQNDGDTPLKSGFGAKMLARMGYKGEGGLGKEGAGISEPIQVVLRATKGGVGIVSEKSEQQKRQERRKAEANGEVYVDTSEEERRERRAKAKARGEPRTAAPRAKKTMFELEAAGMKVPLALQSIFDAATGVSTPTSSLSLRTDAVPFESSLQARIRRDLTSFSHAFEELQAEAKAIPPHEHALDKELAALQAQIEELEDIQARLASLRTASLDGACQGLKSLHAAYPSRPLYRESVAVICPHFARAVASWAPLHDALEEEAAALYGLANILQPQSRRSVFQTYTHPSDAVVSNIYVGEDEQTKRGMSTWYETMMLKLWLPAVSSAVTQWDVKDPTPMIHLLGVWRPVLPYFIGRRVLQQIVRKLSAAVHEWNPRKTKKSPHAWVVEWLPYLEPADVDLNGSGLLAEMRRKVRHAMQSMDLSRGPPSGMESWKRVLGKSEFDRLLTAHLVPRLAILMRDQFEINPAEQELAALETVFAWKGLVSSQTVGELLRAQFFPKLLDIIHQWLSSEEVIFKEVEEWLTWWRNGVWKDEINELPSVAAGWMQAYALVEQALELGEARLTDLPAPQMESGEVALEPGRSSRPIRQDTESHVAQVDEVTFKDMVEEFCAEENLLLLPLREAHDRSGSPLFRITASATGRGGAIAYFQGDLLWVQNKKDKSAWEATGLDQGLVAKAEGR